jgi:hypothetical protein
MLVWKDEGEEKGNRYLLQNYYCVDGDVLREVVSESHCWEVVPS